MSIKVMSFDSSTKKTGVAFFVDGQLTNYKLLDYSEIKDTETRIEKMSKAIWNELCIFSPAFVFAEDTWNARNIATSKLLTEILGVIKGWCIGNNRDFKKLLPSEWRKYAGINQSKKKREELKAESIAYVKKKYNIDVNDDVADAITLGDSVFNYFDGLLDL